MSHTPCRNPERHESVIANFRAENGVTLPQARIVYGTYGHLNAARDNVVLLPSHYMANFQGYQWLIGPNARSTHPNSSWWRRSCLAMAVPPLPVTRRSPTMVRVSR